MLLCRAELPTARMFIADGCANVALQATHLQLNPVQRHSRRLLLWSAGGRSRAWRYSMLPPSAAARRQAGSQSPSFCAEASALPQAKCWQPHAPQWHPPDKFQVPKENSSGAAKESSSGAAEENSSGAALHLPRPRRLVLQGRPHRHLPLPLLPGEAQ